MHKRFKRALREPLAALGFSTKSALFIKAILLVITATLIRIFVEDTQMPAAIEGILIGVGALISVYVLLFLFYLIKPPAPKRRDSNFVITLRATPIVYGGKDELPSIKDDMQWISAYMDIDVNYPTEIQTLHLLLKGKPRIAHGWNPIMSNRMITPRLYYFQVPTSVDLTKHKAQIVASTNNEDYGSDEFAITQW